MALKMILAGKQGIAAMSLKIAKCSHKCCFSDLKVDVKIEEKYHDFQTR